jgi:hypothetical protein
MIVGHLGIALGARAVDREAPLGWLVVASLAPDIIDLAVAAAGVCNPDGAYTHSLAAVAGTALVLGVTAAWNTHRGRTGLLVAALVVAHLLADYVTGQKALWIGGPLIGLNLYQWGWADFAVEAPIIVGGWYAARRWGDPPRWLAGRAAFAVLLGAQLLFDAIPTPAATGAQEVCAKAGIIQQLQRFF